MIPEAPTQDNIERAAALLRSGRLVAFPTETVYGLGADATNARAVASLYEAKGRPRFNPLISHVATWDAAQALARMTPLAARLAEAFWPGPLTLVLEKAAGCPVCDLATAGLDTIAVRVPAHPVAAAVIAGLGRPVVAPSANISGRVSATTAQDVASDFGDRIAMIIDGGPARLGLESTILDARGDAPILLRAGALTREAIASALGMPVHDASSGRSDRPSSPGQLESHYAPAAAVRLDVTAPTPGEALLAFGPDVPGHDGPAINLSPSGDLVEAAANLFTALRQLDATGADTIAVMPIPAHGLGEAINDRLRRAAAPR